MKKYNFPKSRKPNRILKKIFQFKCNCKRKKSIKKKIKRKVSSVSIELPKLVCQ